MAELLFPDRSLSKLGVTLPGPPVPDQGSGLVLNPPPSWERGHPARSESGMRTGCPRSQGGAFYGKEAFLRMHSLTSGLTASLRRPSREHRCPNGPMDRNEGTTGRLAPTSSGSIGSR